jgi:hypothetical protein
MKDTEKKNENLTEDKAKLAGDGGGESRRKAPDKDSPGGMGEGQEMGER